MAEYNYTCGDCLYVQFCDADPSLRAFDRKNTAYCKAFKNAANVAKVVHSEWGIIEFNKEEGFVTVECKNCDAAFTIEMLDYGLSYNFCPSCGAEMSGERRAE